MLELIQTNAEIARDIARKMLGREIAYDLAGVTWLDGFLQRQHEHGDPGLRDQLVSICGSFLGECIVRCYGWSWSNDNGGWCVSKDQDNAAYPFAKVDKQLEFGAEDSVLSFFTSIPLVFADSNH